MELTAKILIADESAAERATLRGGLRRAGYQLIEEAANGEEALQKLRHGHFDAAMCNMMLTRLDGIGLLRACRAENCAPPRYTASAPQRTAASSALSSPH